MRERAAYLTADEEKALARRWRDQRDEKAMHQLVQAYGPLARGTAGKMSAIYGLPKEDLVQEAFVGLMEAARRFDPERDNRFGTYASWWIKSAVQDYILSNKSLVRAGKSVPQKNLFYQFQRVYALYAKKGTMSAGEIRRTVAKELRVSLADVESMQVRLSVNGTISLSAPIGDDDRSTIGDFIPSDDPGPDELAEQAIDGQRSLKKLRSALRGLKPRERKIINRRHLGEEKETLEVLGAEMGISKERVRQIEEAAMDRLRSKMVAA